MRVEPSKTQNSPLKNNTFAKLKMKVQKFIFEYLQNADI